MSLQVHQKVRNFLDESAAGTSEPTVEVLENFENIKGPSMSGPSKQEEAEPPSDPTPADLHVHTLKSRDAAAWLPWLPSFWFCCSRCDPHGTVQL